MKTPLVSWALSAALHGSLAGMAAFWVAGELERDDGRGACERGSPRARPRELPRHAPMEHNSPSLTFRVGVNPADRENIVPSSKPGDPPEYSTRFKGESLDFVSDKPFRGKGVYDVAGAGGGGGGRYGAWLNPENRAGDPHDIGAVANVRDALLSALGWLARHQRSDGLWEDAPDWDATALAVTAFLEAGFGPDGDRTLEEIAVGGRIRLGLQRLAFHAESGALPAFVLADAFRLTRSGLLREAAAQAIDGLLARPPADPAGAFWSAMARGVRPRGRPSRPRPERPEARPGRRRAPAPGPSAPLGGGRLPGLARRERGPFPPRRGPAVPGARAARSAGPRPRGAPGRRSRLRRPRLVGARPARRPSLLHRAQRAHPPPVREGFAMNLSAVAPLKEDAACR